MGGVEADITCERCTREKQEACAVCVMVSKEASKTRV